MNIKLEVREEFHVKEFWEKTQEEDIQRMFPFSSQSLEESMNLFKKSLNDNAASYGRVIYYEDRYIGDIWCYSIDETNEKMAMFSIVIFEKEIWRKGLATMATKLFIENVFEKYQVNRLGAFTYSFNYGSINLLRKIGFTQVESFVDHGIESLYFELSK